jgi:GNAT superfamily N-acetyltransferase
MNSNAGHSWKIREIRPDEEKIARDVFYAALDDVHAGLKNKHQAPGADLLDIQESYTNQPGCVFLVGLVDDQIVATGALTRLNDRQVKLRRMSVSPAYQGRGYGKAMLARLEVLAREFSYAEILLDTAGLLTAAIEMYTRAGYAEFQRENVGDGMPLIYFRKRLR